LWGSRVVVPKVLCQQVLDELHESHPGVSRMKAIARGVVWWPEMNSEIESKVHSCRECQLNQKTPAQAPLHPWEWPSQPWTRLHIDYAGPFLGKMFLVVVDAHSKWLEVEMVPTTSSRHTIEKLRSMFAMHGLPELLVSDNASVFTSAEFKEFLKRNGIRHATSAPYHPSSNGLAERYVQTFKVAMKKCSAEDIQQQLSRFLFHYRTTPHTVTGVSPA
ncbi:MAG: DDE-type integrase/transposase/recombinase, partial [Alphaproteobacteria bacterium]|nr:DDE-type integrase/transposase/recombinase [Alphaproteobacteria bacterium]